MTFHVKGWCPGALRPMQSGDGWIVRVRPREGTLSLPALRAIAEAAARFGNGQIDFTRRANLQIRGVRENAFEPLLRWLTDHDLLDADPVVEAARNIIVSPLSGLDPHEGLDMRPMARELGRHLVQNAHRWRLPAKFGFVMDGDGMLSLGEAPGDVRLLALGTGGPVALGIAAKSGTVWLGSLPPEQAVSAIDHILSETMASEETPFRGKRYWEDETIDSAKHLLADILVPLPELRKPSRPPRRLGILDLGSRCGVAIGLPFGRIEARRLNELVAALTDAGADDVRVAPWRVIYAGLRDRQAARDLCDQAKILDLILDAADPLRRVEACPGSPACAATSLLTREDARRLAQRAKESGFLGTIHVSGCAKGCARSAPAELVLIGADGHYGVVRHGTARDTPSTYLLPEDLDSRLDFFTEIG
jgi:precorrin-3B synthase